MIGSIESLEWLTLAPNDGKRNLLLAKERNTVKRISIEMN